jgi:hypothetical protein
MINVYDDIRASLHFNKFEVGELLGKMTVTKSTVIIHRRQNPETIDIP